MSKFTVIAEIMAMKLNNKVGVKLLCGDRHTSLQ